MRATPVDVRLHRIPKHLKLHVADEKPAMRHHNQKLKRNLTGEVSDITKGISSGADCVEPFNPGTVVKLVAQPAAASCFQAGAAHVRGPARAP